MKYELGRDVRTSDVRLLTCKYLQYLFPRHHVDRVVVGRATELSLLRRGRVSERDAETAADTKIRANGTYHPAVTVGFFDDTAGDGTGSLTNRARKRTEAAIGVDDRDRLRSFLARPGHHLGPHAPRL